MDNSTITTSICRACLSETDEFKSVFVSDDNSGYTIHLCEMIMACASIQITFGDGLPDQICVACAEQTVKMYLFKIKCEESDKILREGLKWSGVQEISNVREEKYSEYVKINGCNGTDLDGTIKSEITIEDPHLRVEIDDKTQATFGFNETENIGSDSKEPVLASNELHKKDFKCDVCNKTLSTQSMLDRHMKSHSMTVLECPKCNKRFNRHYDLLRHSICHNGKKPFFCSTCHKGFNRLVNMRQHMIRHSGVKAHQCTTCGKDFVTKAELSVHLRKHTGARPFVCPLCSQRFTASGALKVHKRLHSGEKPYECDVCKMKFTQSGTLTCHKRTHTGEKPYACKFCVKAYSQSNELATHVRIHTGEKPYICDKCGLAFRVSKTLRKHEKTHLESTGVVRTGVNGGGASGDFLK